MLGVKARRFGVYTRRTMLATACLLVLGLSACAVPGTNEESRTQSDLWPFYTTDYFRKSGDQLTRSLSPIGSYTEKANGDTEATLRPFYTFVDSPNSLEREHTLLYPVGRYRTQFRDYGEADDRIRKDQVWLLPFFYYSYFSAAPGHSEVDWFAPFPLFVGGDSTLDGAHFSAFPFGGNLKGLFGVDEITYALGPLYVHLREGETNTLYFPFPLLRYGSGPGYSSFGALPFYSHSKLEGRYERNAVMWPLVNWGQDNLNTAWPREYWSVLPFAARQWTAESNLISILPPFFNYGEWAHTNTTILDAPWPFFRTASGDNYEEFRIWPLYSHWREGQDWNSSMLWPIFWKLSESDPAGAWQETTYRAWPIWNSRYREYTPDANGYVARQSSVMAWPLFYHTQKVDGAWQWSFPSPLPYFDERFERSYRELFKVIALSGDDDSSTVELLWGMFRWHDSPYETSRALHPLFRYHQRKIRMADGSVRNGEESFDILFGLFGVESAEDGSRVTVLWLIRF
ncbi:MAG: hypothetical protein KDB07_01145 [Planctomycetes bacterium]|nr:hypothetical protein [Planctomycetota bacterium]